MNKAPSRPVHVDVMLTLKSRLFLFLAAAFLTSSTGAIGQPAGQTTTADLLDAAVQRSVFNGGNLKILERELFTLSNLTPAQRERCSCLAEDLEEFQRRNGRLTGYELADWVAITSSVEQLFVVLTFEEAPLYLRLEAYNRPRGGWIFTDYQLDEDRRKAFSDEPDPEVTVIIEESGAGVPPEKR